MGYVIDESTLSDHPILNHYRSVYLEGQPPRLLVNGKMMAAQKAFIYAREIGYNALNLKERAITSSWLKVKTFNQVFNNFKASYFAGALLMNRQTMIKELESLFAKPEWVDGAILLLMDRLAVTPEMFFYRLTEILPAHFGMKDLYFVRFTHDPTDDRLELTKVLNMSDASVPHGLWLNEHYCRRWPDSELFRKVETERKRTDRFKPIMATQRSHFEQADATYFVLSMARPLTLSPGKNSCVSIGLLIDDAFKQTVKAWNDAGIPEQVVNLTCERCGIADCRERAAEPSLYRAAELREEMEAALATLTQTYA